MYTIYFEKEKSMNNLFFQPLFAYSFVTTRISLAPIMCTNMSLSRVASLEKTELIYELSSNNKSKICSSIFNYTSRIVCTVLYIFKCTLQIYL